MKTFSKNSEKSLLNLAVLLKIPIAAGWKTRLSEWFDVELPILSNWIRRGIPKRVMRNIQNRGYPKELWYVVDNIKEYPETPEQMGIPQHSGSDTPAYEYTDPSRKVFEVTALANRHVSDEEYIDAVREIFQSGEYSTIQALKMNIAEFQEKVRYKKREKTSKDLSGNPGAIAENE